MPPRLWESLWAGFLLLTSLAAHAQTTATLRGRVIDPQNQAVPGAIVTISNAVTGLRREVATGTDGRYEFTNLTFQTYVLTAQSSGFALERHTVNLRSNVPVVFDIEMHLAQQIISLDVAGGGPFGALLDTDATGTRTELNAGAIEKMPMATGTRGIESVLLSFPGFAANANGAIHPRGAHNQMTFVVDGMPISDQLTGAFANALDASMVESVDLHTGNIPAEFGNKVSAVAVVTTRSGLGSNRKFSGSTQKAAAQFDTLQTISQFAGATGKVGYFASFTGLKSNRFLDQVGILNLHNGGNSQRAYARVDYQVTSHDVLRTSFMLGRSSFQHANLRSQHANLQNQRQALEDASAALTWIRTLNARSTFEAVGSFRNAFARFFPSPGDTPVTAAQARRLSTWTFGARYNRISGIHNIRGGFDLQRFPMREHFSFGITHPDFNYPGGENFIPTLVPYDLTRGGGWFHFSGRGAGALDSAYIQDQVRWRRFLFSLGLRYDNFRFLTRGDQLQPRLGLSFHLKETGTVLRASYNRTFQTPPNENLLLSNSDEAAILVPPGVRATLGGAFLRIRPERQNVYEVGLQQSLGRAGTINAAYYHKDIHDLQDNDNFFNTGIIFPTSLTRGRVNGAEGRVNLFPGRRLSTSLSATHYRVVVTPPFTGGLFLGATAIEALGAGPFIIDHDQMLGLQTNTVYNITRSLWASLIIRHDSGLVSNPSDPEVVRHDPDFYDLLPYVNLESDPTRVRPRTLTDIAVGYLRQREGRRQWEAVFTVTNLFDQTALFNFQSIFVGTRLVQPRAAGVRFRWFF
jgi:hypothetical protein